MAEKDNNRNSLSNINYRIAKLLKQYDNRLCADCCEPLIITSTSIHASLYHQVWLCSLCYNSHVDVLGTTHPIIIYLYLNI